MQHEGFLYRTVSISFPNASDEVYSDFDDSFGNPGEPLVLFRGADPVTFFERERWFQEVTGLAGDRIVSSPLCAVPLPLAVRDDLGLLQRWPSEMNSELLWLPIFWLPEMVLTRFLIDNGIPGEERIETDDEWALRVASELGAAGLYDPETGSWMDVLAAHGIDIEAPDTVLRLGAWLEGESDPVLDNIDLSPLFALTDEAGNAIDLHSEALQFALDATPLATTAQFCSFAECLMERMQVTVYNEANLASRIEQVDEIATLSLLLLGAAELPAPAEQVVDIVQDARDSIDEIVEGDAELAPEDAWVAVETIADDLSVVLNAVASEYAPFREAWDGAFAELSLEEVPAAPVYGA
jgi:hypothetical protein